MKKLDGWILTAFSYGFPIIACLILFMSFQDQEKFASTWPGLNSAIGSFVIAWLSCSFFMGIRLVVSAEFRERTMTKLAMMKESDEREEFLTGKATRTVFLANLGILVFALLLSVVTIKLEKLPPEKVVDGNQHSLSIGLSIGSSPSTSSEKAQKTANSDSNALFVYRGIPISVSMLIIFAILWQIAIYNISMRRFLAGNHPG